MFLSKFLFHLCDSGQYELLNIYLLTVFFRDVNRLKKIDLSDFYKDKKNLLLILLEYLAQEKLLLSFSKEEFPLRNKENKKQNDCLNEIRFAIKYLVKIGGFCKKNKENITVIEKLIYAAEYDILSAFILKMDKCQKIKDEEFNAAIISIIFNYNNIELIRMILLSGKFIIPDTFFVGNRINVEGKIIFDWLNYEMSLLSPNYDLIETLLSQYLLKNLQHRKKFIEAEKLIRNESVKTLFDIYEILSDKAYNGNLELSDLIYIEKNHPSWLENITKININAKIYSFKENLDRHDDHDIRNEYYIISEQSKMINKFDAILLKYQFIDVVKEKTQSFMLEIFFDNELILTLNSMNSCNNLSEENILIKEAIQKKYEFLNDGIKNKINPQKALNKIIEEAAKQGIIISSDPSEISSLGVMNLLAKDAAKTLDFPEILKYLELQKNIRKYLDFVPVSYQGFLYQRKVTNSIDNKVKDKELEKIFLLFKTLENSSNHLAIDYFDLMEKVVRIGVESKKQLLNSYELLEFLTNFLQNNTDPLNKNIVLENVKIMVLDLLEAEQKSLSEEIFVPLAEDSSLDKIQEETGPVKEK